MKTSCPHCQVAIQIDPSTLAAFAGRSHFNCPACQGLVALPSRTRKLASAHSGINRNLLVLGILALLVLGGIGFLLASRKSGDTNTTIQNIRNEIINNTYFQTLIATGVTTKEDLEAIGDIRPYQDGFIGISKAGLDWKEANALAMRTGSVVLETAADDKLHPWLTETFALPADFAAWVLSRGEVGLLTGAGAVALKHADGSRKVLLHWKASAQADDEKSEPAPVGGKSIISDWKILNGRWTDEEGGRSGVGDIDAILLSDIQGVDFEYEADITLRTDLPTAGSLVFRAKDRAYEQCYVVNISTETGGVVKLFKLPYQPLVIHKTPIQSDKTYHLKVAAEGERIRVYFDRSPEPVIDFNDAASREGKFGLLSWSGKANFRNVLITHMSQPKPYSGRQLSEIVDLESAAVWVDDEFDDPAKSGFSWIKDPFKDGRITLDGMGGPSWGTGAHQFNNFAVQVVARATRDKHRGWGVCIYKHPQGEDATGVDVLLDSEGMISIKDCRWTPEGKKFIDPVGPLPVASFRKGEFNTLVCAFSEGNKLAVFVNGAEACPPIQLPYLLEPAVLQLSSSGGMSMPARLEFESFKVFSLVEKK